MNLSILRTLSILTTLAVGLATASLGFSTTITIGGTPSGTSGETTSVSETSVTDFDTWTLPSNYTLTGSAGIVSGNANGQYASPAGDSTPYLSTGTGSVTINFSAEPIDYFGLYWGSVDAYNGIVFTDTLGNTSAYSGSSLAALGVLVNGNESAYVNFFGSGSEQWSSVTLFSTENAFEFDNVATAAPEPASLAMAGLGMGLAAFGIIRRRKLQTQIL
jgi:hypothetical protein